MTRQMADDEVLRVLDNAAYDLQQWTAGCGPSTPTLTLLKELPVARSAVAALQAERDALRDDVKLLTRKVITCGVAAANPDPELSSSGPYGGEWDSPQAQDVRALRSRAERAESALEALRGQVAGLVAAAEEASSSLAHHAQSAYCSLGDADESVITALNAALLAIKERMG